MNTIEEKPYFAAIDLGSNSFHLLVVKINNGVIEKIDKVKEMVQIALDLDKEQGLSQEAQARAIDCLSRFHERIRDIPSNQIRVAGTKALRSAKNANVFLQQAEQALGHKIDIISGYEEARLVYCGVSHDVSEDMGRRLVIDIGGGSTEFIIGEGHQTRLLESLSIGCVTYSDKFFKCRKSKTDSPEILTHEKEGHEKVGPEMIWKTYYATCNELEAIRTSYQHMGWDITIGSSGTMRAIAQLMQDDVVTGVITQAGLSKLINRLHQHGFLEELSEIPAKRRNVLPAGIVILSAIFDQLDIKEIHVVDAALKEGLIYDTIGRLNADDIRDQTVEKMVQQYHIDQSQADRVKKTLLYFAKQLPSPVVNRVNVQKLLHWAAHLHEIGLGISHSGHHHHGHYLIQQSDMAGFSRFEQELLALLVGSHRRKISRERLVLFMSDNQQMLYPLLACLRLAVLFNQRREDDITLPSFLISREENGTLHLQLNFPTKWLDNHPLTHYNLSQEQKYLSPLNIELAFQ